MATSITGLHGRKLTIDARNENHPTSVFIGGPRSFMFEADREAFRELMCRELGLVRKNEDRHLVAV